MNLERKGCIQPIAPPHLHKMAFRMHEAMSVSLLDSFDQRETGLVADVKDQGRSSACEAHSGHGATETYFSLLGEPLGFVPSEIDFYRGLRSVDRARRTPMDLELPKLEDNGGMTEDSLTYMATFGITRRLIERTSDGRNSDVEVATVNDNLSLGTLEASRLLVVVDSYAIDPYASDAEQQVKAALMSKIPVRVDAFVDRVFEDWVPGKAPIPPPDVNDKKGGGHAVYLVGYGPGYYILRNSWGPSEGDGGDYLVSPAWLRSAWGIYPWATRRVS